MVRGYNRENVWDGGGGGGDAHLALELFCIFFCGGRLWYMSTISTSAMCARRGSLFLGGVALSWLSLGVSKL